ncbi:hypothetical protein JL720_9646 [Aureococcus anophagefferens]|nr:hypothetical protein JL720_9646 [Aureococcus anophagefferens]
MKRLHALSSSEALYAPRSDYIDAVQVDGMKEAWRTKIMAWLASIASIFLASKIEETRPFRTSDFVTLSDGLFSGSDLRLMELELLCALKWHLNPPTIQASVHGLLTLFDDRFAVDVAAVGRRALASADRARGDVHFLKYPPSMIAVAAVIIGLKREGADVATVAEWTRRPDDADAEVVHATAGRPPPVSTAGPDVDAARAASDDEGRDRVSPNNVMDVAAVERPRKA